LNKAVIFEYVNLTAMKILLAFLLLSSAFTEKAVAQKIDKYCEVVMYYKSLSESVRPSVQWGKDDSLFSFKDPSVAEALKQVNKLKTRVDVLNYMSLQGWVLAGNSLEAVYTGSFLGGSNQYFIFKRSFDPSELNIP
jgi:hypothetical protein